jgi:hypothetical protein
MTNKDVSIMVTACLKSIIESGCSPSEWETRLMDACRLVVKTTNAINDSIAKAKPPSNESQPTQRKW